MEQKNNLNENNSLQDSSLSQSNLLASSMLSLDDVEDLINCPVSHEIMFDPVFLPSGNTVEKEEVTKHGKDPFSREPLDASKLVINRLIKKMIEKVLSKNPTQWEMVYESPAHRKKVIDAFSEGDAKELGDLLSKDPRVIYEKLKIGNAEATLLEHAVINKKYFVCIPKIIAHTSTNPLGGVERLKEIVNQNSIFNNLVGQQAIVEIKLIAEAFLWGRKDYESFCLNALRGEHFSILAFFCSKDAPITLKDLRPEGRPLLYHAIINNSPTSILKECIKELPEETLAEDMVYLVDLKPIGNEPPLDESLPGLQSLRVALNLLGGDIKLFNYCALNCRDKIPLIAKLLDWQPGFFQEVARFIPVDAHASSILQSVVSYGIDPNYIYKDRGESLLCYYALNGSVPLVQELLKLEKLQVNTQREDNRQTVLHQCAMLGERLEVVRVLLESGKCDLWIKDGSNKIPLDYSFSNPEMLAVLIPYYHPEEVFKYLVENYTQDPRFKEYFKAAGFTQEFLLKKIKEFIASKDFSRLSSCMSLVTDLNIIANDYELITAVLSSDDTKCLEVICQYDVILQARVNGNTLVHEAIRLKNVNAVFFLLDKGIALEGDDAKNAKGQKPEEYAKELELDDLAEQIKNRRKKLKLEKQQGPLIKQIQDLTAQLSAKDEQLNKLNQVVAPLQKKKQKIAEFMQMFPIKGAASKRIKDNLPLITTMLELPPNYLVTSAGANIYMWDITLHQRTILSTNKIFSGQISHLVLLEQGENFASADDEGNIYIWDFNKKNEAKKVNSYRFDGKILNLARLSDNRIGCIIEDKPSGHGLTSYKISIFSRDEDKPIKRYLDNLLTSSDFFIKDNQSYLVIARKSLSFSKSHPKIVIYQIKKNGSFDEVVSFEAHTSNITNIMYHNSGKLVSTSNTDMKLWDVSNIEKPIEESSSSIKGNVKQVIGLKNNCFALVIGKQIAVYHIDDLHHVYTYESDHVITAIHELSNHKLLYAQNPSAIENSNSAQCELCILTHPSSLRASQIFKESEEDIASVCKQM